MKNYIHGILLQNAIKIPRTSFSSYFIERLMDLDDYSIDEYVRTTQFFNDRIMQVDLKIKAVQKNRNAQLLESITGVGKFSALLIAA